MANPSPLLPERSTECCHATSPRSLLRSRPRRQRSHQLAPIPYPPHSRDRRQGTIRSPHRLASPSLPPQQLQRFLRRLLASTQASQPPSPRTSSARPPARQPVL